MRSFGLMTDYNQFAGALLGALGAPNNGSTVGFLTAWMAREGTNAGNNPLATTEPWPGSTDFNSVGVKNYATEADGVAATVATLTGGYPNIVNDLRRGDGNAAGNEHGELAKWSGGGYDTIGAGGGAGNVGGGSGMSGDSWLSSFGDSVGGFFVDILSLIGLAFGGGQAAAAPTIVNLQQDAFQREASKALTPEQAAIAVLKGQGDHGQMSNEAAMGGYNQSRFDMLISLTGNPPGPQELLTMWRRGILNEGSVDQGLKEGYLRDEWIPFLKLLHDDIISTFDAVNGAVQGHMTYGEAQLAAERNGTPAIVFDLMFQNAGNPPGPTETLTMLNRGIIDEPTAVLALQESRLKDKYIPAVLQLARRRIPLRSITQLLNAGAITDADAIADLRALGYNDADAAAIVAGHSVTKHATQKELSVSAVRELYTGKLIDAGEAAADLVAIGYTGAAAQELVALWATADDRKLRTAAVGRVRSAFDARRITAAQASNQLDALGVPPTLRDEQLSVWTIEQADVTRELTPADIAAAGRDGIFTVNETLARLEALGYSPDDAVVFAQVHKVIPLPTQPGA